MDYTDFLTRLFKKTGGKNYHLILDTVASKVKMADGSTVEDSLNNAKTQADAALLGANTAQQTALIAENKAQEALDEALLKLNKSTAASELAGEGLYVKDNKLNMNEDDISDILQRLEYLEKVFAENMVYNEEIYITESGDFIVPYTGYYEVTCVDGGNGSVGVGKNQTIRSAIGGASGARITKIIFLEKDAIIPVIIGGGGISGLYMISDSNVEGGKTKFGDIDTDDILADTYWANAGNLSLSDSNPGLRSPANGPNGGPALFSNNGDNFRINDGLGYGGGGGASCNNMNFGLGNGQQGYVKLRFHNPTKEGE